LGVSPDPVASHAKFAKKLNLNYPILADPERTLIDPLGLWVEKSMYGKTYFGVERSTFLLDENGKIIKVWRKVKPEGHAKEVLEALSVKREA
jgi:peroxiredoxin Q/BCP